MITRLVYICEICGYENHDLMAVRQCESREHFKANGQFAVITKEIIDQFIPRLEAIRAIDKRQYIDSGPTSLYRALYGLFVAGHYCTLLAALNEVEGLYAKTPENRA